MRKIFIAILGVVMFASGCGNFALPAETTKLEVKLPKDEIAKVEDIAKPMTRNVIKEVSESQGYFSMLGVEGKTALEILKEKTKVETKSYGDLGEFVLGIDGVFGDTKNFWAFYVNGKKASVGAGSYQTQAGDMIEWKLEQVDALN